MHQKFGQEPLIGVSDKFWNVGSIRCYPQGTVHGSLRSSEDVWVNISRVHILLRCTLRTFDFVSLLNFVIDDIINRLLDFGGDLKYSDHIAILSDNVQTAQHMLSRIVIEACEYDMQFASNKCKVPMKDWQEPIPA